MEPALEEEEDDASSRLTNGADGSGGSEVGLSGLDGMEFGGEGPDEEAGGPAVVEL